MKNIKLLSDQLLICDFVSQLSEVETFDDGWTIKYIDPLNRNTWIKYSFENGFGVQFLLVQLPHPSTEELINIALSSINEDEVISASLFLKINELQKKLEFREKLIERLEKIELYDLQYNEKQRLINIIEYSELNNNINRRVILNKNYVEIQRDADLFKQISKRANSILKKLDR
jgi:hypothetical protein